MKHTACWGLLVWLTVSTSPAFAQREYGFDNGKPSGQPYLTPAESIKRMTVPPGWEVKLFAAEPEVINPIAFTIDERGRVWVVECYEYPSRTPKGKMPRDRIIILEDTDGDGQADKRTVFAEGKDFPVRFDLASGIEVGHGGVFLGAPPYLWYLQDTNNDGKCDKHEILLKGFGSHDTHETLNTFQWGPDGWLYGLHGVFTHSDVTPHKPEAQAKDAPPVKMNAAVWRYHPRTKKFEIFAEGTSNPWGMDFDQHGNCFLVCCVIPHLFHIVPGGVYIRQAGTSFNPYAYGALKEISDHQHHKESGWAHAGLLVMQGKHVPEEYQNSVLMGSIHGCSIKRDVLRRNGSTFIASHAPDFLVSGDKNFRPINLRWGPDGSIYVIDWHDQNPCHQAAPDSWDKTHGRVYRIQQKGTKNTSPGDLKKLTLMGLIDVIWKADNPFAHRTALRLLGERSAALQPGDVWRTMFTARSAPEGEAANQRTLWALHAGGDSLVVLDKEPMIVNDLLLAAMLMEQGKDSGLAIHREWAVRIIGDQAKLSSVALESFRRLAKIEGAAIVRLQLASASQKMALEYDRLPILHNLLRHKEDATDPCIPFMLWLAYEPQLAAKSQTELDWLKANAPGNPLITDHIIPRVMRRLIAPGKREDLTACVQFLGETADKNVRRQALTGLTEAFKGRLIEPPAEWQSVYAELQKEGDAEIKRLTQQLAVHFRDAGAILRALATLRETSSPKTQQLDAIRALAVVHPPEALRPLLDIVTKGKDDDLRRAAANALSSFDSNEVPKTVLPGWKEYSPGVRVELVNVLKGRRDWARQLLDAVGKNQVPRTDLTDNTILAIRAFNDRGLNDQIEKAWGRYRATPEELDKLIGKMRTFVADKPGDPAKGKLVFAKTCMQCHKFDGQGHEVGPQLDGADRSVEYLLINVLDPNRVIGQPYYQRVVALKSGKIVTGLVAAEDGQSLTLKRENAALDVIQRSDIEEMKTVEKSLMPEGLGNNMTPEEFRDLIAYLVRREVKK